MRLVLTDQVAELLRHCTHGLRSWHRLAVRGKKRGLQAHAALTKELLSHGTGEELCERRGHGIADLPLHRLQAAADLVAVGHRLQPAELAPGKAPILPVEGPDRGSGLRLNRPRRLRLGELQKEAPVATAPAEEPQASASLGAQIAVSGVPLPEASACQGR